MKWNNDWKTLDFKKQSLCLLHTCCGVWQLAIILFEFTSSWRWCEIIKDTVNVFESYVTSHVSEITWYVYVQVSESRNGTTKYLTNIFLIFTNFKLIMSHIYDSSWNFSHILSGKYTGRSFQRSIILREVAIGFDISVRLRDHIAITCHATSHDTYSNCDFESLAYDWLTHPFDDNVQRFFGVTCQWQIMSS